MNIAMLGGFISYFQTHPMWTPDGSTEVLGISEGIVEDSDLVSPSLSVRKAISQFAIFDSQDKTFIVHCGVKFITIPTCQNIVSKCIFSWFT